MAIDYKERFKNRNVFNSETGRAAGKKGGRANTPKKLVANLKKLQKSPNWLKNNTKMSDEQIHFVTLLHNNQFATFIKDALVFIATKAETADDYHKLLMQVMKLPFIQKVWDDIQKTKQKDVIPIVIEVLRDNDAEKLIKPLLERLQDAGWNPTTEDSGVPEMPSL